jgi:hypothetical protein
MKMMPKPWRSEWRVAPVFPLSVLVILTSGLCFAQAKSERLLLKVEQASSGPFGGQRGSLCLQVYSNGRIVYSDWSRSAMGLVDKAGKETRPERTANLEYRAPEQDSWQASELEESLTSKRVLRLASSFDPPHKPTDFIETTVVRIMLPKGKTKQISLREFYVASLAEKAKYPSALVILMDRIARIEDEVAEKGKAIDPPPDCPLQKQ